MGRRSVREKQENNAWVHVTPKRMSFDTLVLETLGSNRVRMFPFPDRVVIVADERAHIKIENGVLAREEICAKVYEYVGGEPEVHKTGEHRVTLYRRD